MMMKAKATRCIAAIASLAALAACGNDPERAVNIQQAAAGITQLFKGKPAPQRVTQEQIAAALAATDQPVIFAEFEFLKSSVLLIQIEQNGPVTTFATGGRQTISLENGVLRASRGLSDDLMSTELGSLRTALSTGADMAGARVLRFLNGASETYEITATCSYTGEMTVIETCTKDDGSSAFTNTYDRSPDGHVMSSRQWLSPSLGYVTIKRLQ
ncbi:YjbF family lipoprotein [Roseobacteraceae bacterium S113]